MQPFQQPEEALLHAALALPPGRARRAFLDQACATRPALRQRLDTLLEARQPPQEGRAGDTVPASRATLKLDFPDKPGSETVGQVIGRYRLLERVGEGGCGVVYVAEQTEPVRRRVALKVIKLGMDTKQVVARFEAERQVLAMMDHPNIAKVLDAGTTGPHPTSGHPLPSDGRGAGGEGYYGRPYFVMELVRGIRITDYCDQANLSTKERLDLFIKVCQAIQHAHQKGIIHRDIKPSNILVTLHDGVPVPKVIDFGIAKATEGRLTDATVYTQLHQFIGTPAYMSPEQAEMSELDIDTRSDIYSLGVLLYELLAGSTPFDAKELMAAGIDAMRKTIREQEPPRPSTRLSQTLVAADVRRLNSPSADKPTTEDEVRASSRRLLRIKETIALIKGDLDWIVMKCLEKDRTRRYETANGLVADLKRHLNHEPVVARPPSAAYRFQKAWQRNRLACAAGLCIAVALILGLVASLWQAHRARIERDAATCARQQAEALNRFLTEDLLFQAIPDQNPRERKISLEEGLRLAAQRLDQKPEIARQPELEAALRLSVGVTCFRLGLLDEAELHLRRAWDIRQTTLGPRHVETLLAQLAYCVFLNEGLRRFEESEIPSREAWEGLVSVLGPEHLQTLEALDNYGMILAQLGKYELSERRLRQCLQVRERVLGPNAPLTLTSLNNLSLLFSLRGELQEAERVQRDVLERYRRTGLLNREDAFATAYNLGLNLFFQGRTEEAGQLLTELYTRATSFFGPEHYHTMHIQQTRLRILVEFQRWEEAVAMARTTLEVRRRTTPQQEGTGRTLLYLGHALIALGKLDEAEPYLQEALALFREHYARKPDLAAQAANWLGTIQLARRAFPEAEALLLPSAGPLCDSSSKLSSGERRVALGNIVSLYAAQGKPEPAAEWKQKLAAFPQAARAAEKTMSQP
jgi:serine/threonine protein kinase